MCGRIKFILVVAFVGIVVTYLDLWGGFRIVESWI